MNKKYNKAFKILKIFEQNKIESFIVGGAVRDYLLKTEPNDIDITTQAYPGKVMKLFNAVPTGLKYGSVTILFEDEKFEVTTYRIEEDYNDYRHPDSVTYTDSILEDVKRRDFTINALLLDVKGNLIDYVDGKSDLDNQIIRAIGNADERFNEDALRILRACYFESKLGFTIDEQTKESMKNNAHLLKKLPSERVYQELVKILYEKHTLKAFQTMVDTNIVDNVDLIKDAVEYFLSISEKPYLDTFWATCFIFNKGHSEYFKFSNKDKNKYNKVLELYLNKTTINNLVLYKYGIDITVLYDKVNYYLKKPSINMKKIQEMYNNLPIKSLADLKISSNKLVALTNKKQGAWLGKLLDELAENVILNKVENSEEDLIKFAKNSKHFK